MRKSYEVQGNKVIAKIEALTEEEMKIIKKYIALGFEVVPYVKPEKSTEEGKKEIEYKADDVIKFLEEKASPEDLKTYKALINAPVMVKNKETGKEEPKKYNKDVPEMVELKDPKTGAVKTTSKGNPQMRKKLDENGNIVYLHRKGDVVKKGHIAAVHWFKDNFETDYKEWIEAKNPTE